MKKLLLSIGFLFCFCFLGFGQVDTVAIGIEVDSLIKVSRLLTGQKKIEEAWKSHENAERITLATFGTNSLYYSRCLFNKARIFNNLLQYKDAEPFFIESLMIHEKIMGKSDLEYAGNATSLATMYFKVGRYEDSKKFYQEAKNIREIKLGEENAEYARCLSNLAAVNDRLGNYSEAESLYLKAKDIFAKVSGKEHSDYASILNNLAGLYKSIERFESAETYYLEAIEIRTRKPEKDQNKYASLLYNLGDLYRVLGRYDAVEPLFLEAKSIQKNNIDKNYTNFNITLNGLALFYSSVGREKDAERLYLEAKQNLELQGLKETENYPVVLINLAYVYSKAENLRDAELCFLEAKDIMERTQIKENLEYARCLSGLGRLYLKRREYDLARNKFKEAQEIRYKLVGKFHTEFTNSLIDLSRLDKLTNNFDSAVIKQIQVLEILKNTVGKSHPLYCNSIFELALIYSELSDYSLALPLFEEYNVIVKNLLLKAQYYLSEPELNSYVNFNNEYLDYYYSFMFKSRDVSGEYYNNSIFYKGFLFFTSSKIQNLALQDLETREKYYLLKSYHRRAAQQYTLSINERNINLIKELEEKANTLEKELARTVAGFDQALRQVTWQEVQSALKPNEAALEFIRYNYYTPKPTDSVMYAALLLKPGMEAPAFIPLFEEKQLQAILAPLAGQGSDGLNELYAGQAGQNLFQLLWKPLESALKGSKAIYLSPAGLLHKLNLSAIPTTATSAESIGKRHEIYVVGSTRQLVLSSPTSTPNSTTEAIVFGGIQYEMDTTTIAPALMEENQTRNRGLSFSSTDSTLRGETWRYLKYSEKEVVNIQSQLQKAGFEAKIYKGTSATEEAFKQIGKDKASPKILHLSTHGFFFPDAKNQTKALRFGSEEPVFKISDNPMIRAGLILAGGNYAWKTGKPLGNREDGILTAYEISQMDLRNTDLVVLSACETGLGQIEGNEGVYGLQRAFKIAGAKHLVMSLWQIPDFHTQELMTAFYNNMLTKKMPVREALIAAQEAMRLKRYEPFYWAGFVLLE